MFPRGCSVKEIKLAEEQITLGRPAAGFLRAFGFLTHSPFSVAEPPAVLVHERACCGEPGLKQPLPALNKKTMHREARDMGSLSLDSTPALHSHHAIAALSLVPFPAPSGHFMGDNVLGCPQSPALSPTPTRAYPSMCPSIKRLITPP